MKTEMQHINKEDLVRYLNIYNSQHDWGPELDLLKKRIRKSHGQTEQANKLILNQIACTVLLPLYDKSVITNPPEKLLFTCSKYSQFDSRDWYTDLRATLEKDKKIEQVREQALSFGVIYPIVYDPKSRQALMWLTDRMRKDDAYTQESDESSSRKLENLVYSYGGAVICNVFTKPEYQKKLNGILNWRTGYFFERLIHEVYKPDEILKIKKYEIADIKKSNPKMIKKANRSN